MLCTMPGLEMDRADFYSPGAACGTTAIDVLVNKLHYFKDTHKQSQCAMVNYLSSRNAFGSHFQYWQGFQFNCVLMSLLLQLLWPPYVI